MTNHHYHANAPAVRSQLGDHVDFNPTTKIYTESTGPVTAHSPIVAWLADGLPVYGPYGYAAPMDAKSGLRRMTSGYVKRDGTNGTTNLGATGRTTLPAWAARAQNRTATLPATAFGPAVNNAYALGHFIEDFDYLGDLGKTHGTDFDLNENNVRFCVTPEFPAGTWAYFLTIESNGTPKYPNMVGRAFFGVATGGNVNAINEPVTEFVRASQASPISVSATNAGGAVSITWSSVEGATYKIETSPDATTWSPSRQRRPSPVAAATRRVFPPRPLPTTTASHSPRSPPTTRAGPAASREWVTPRRLPRPRFLRHGAPH